MPRVLETAEAFLQPIQNRFVKASGIQDVAAFPDDALAAFGETDRYPLRSLGREAKVRIAQIFGEDVSRQVVFMEPLHDDNERALFWIVQARLKRVSEEVNRSLLFRFAVGHRRILGVVDDNHVAAFPRQCAACGGGEHKPHMVVLKFVLPVYVIL